MTSSLINSLTRLTSRRCRQSRVIIAGAKTWTQNSSRVAAFSALDSPRMDQQRWRRAYGTSCCLRTHESALSKREMIRQLRDEIRLETETQKLKTVLPSVPGFDVSIDGSLLILTKDGDGETVKISVDVIDSLGREEAFNEEGEVDETVEPEFVARPNFQVDFQRTDGTLAFRCSYVEDIYEGQEDEFMIEQYFTHDGSTNPAQYVALGRNTNPELYDRFMHMLAERGIDGDFAKSLQELAMAHEHRCYIRTLKGITDFLAS